MRGPSSDDGLGVGRGLDFSPLKSNTGGVVSLWELHCPPPIIDYQWAGIAFLKRNHPTDVRFEWGENGFWGEGAENVG